MKFLENNSIERLWINRINQPCQKGKVSIFFWKSQFLNIFPERYANYVGQQTLNSCYMLYVKSFFNNQFSPQFLNDILTCCYTPDCFEILKLFSGKFEHAKFQFKWDLSLQQSWTVCQLFKSICRLLDSVGTSPKKQY